MEREEGKRGERRREKRTYHLSYTHFPRFVGLVAMSLAMVNVNRLHLLRGHA
jgi:hypothetical protein